MIITSASTTAQKIKLAYTNEDISNERLARNDAFFNQEVIKDHINGHNNIPKVPYYKPQNSIDSCVDTFGLLLKVQPREQCYYCEKMRQLIYRSIVKYEVFI